MTNICYTLEEAAEKLKFSETVLVRLSQYLKVPRAAYEESGYLSFKGDLEFSEQDLAFFSQVKERLLLGESLDDVKNRLPQVVISDVQSSVENREGEKLKAAISPLQEGRSAQYAVPGAGPDAVQQPDVLGGVSSTAPGELPPMREIQDRQPYEKAAEKSFERYKSRHRSNIGKVFENMLKEVGGPQSSRRAGSAAMPALRPMRGKTAADSEEMSEEMQESLPHQGEAILPFSRWLGSIVANTPAPGFGASAIPLSQPVEPIAAIARKFNRAAPPDAVWETLVQHAAQKPRTLNVQLKNAALLLRERTLGQSLGGHGADAPGSRPQSR